jgi:transcriptional regulator of acetoin/glycerol metabolism
VRTEIEAALRESQGNVTQAAKALGVSKTALWKRIQVLGLSADKHRP